jgi:hypothetical protein
MPKEGTESFTAYWTITSSNYIQQGNGTFATFLLNGVTRNDAGPMFNLFGQRCVGAVEIVSGNTDRSETGSCTFTDKDGDQVFMHFGDKVVGGHGAAVLVGGTGGFAGITGTVEYFDSPPLKADDKMMRGAVLHKASGNCRSPTTEDYATAAPP